MPNVPNTDDVHVDSAMKHSSIQPIGIAWSGLIILTGGLCQAIKHTTTDNFMIKLVYNVSAIHTMNDLL